MQLFTAQTDKVLFAFSVARDRLDNLALIGVEIEEVRQKLDLEEVVYKFAQIEARKTVLGCNRNVH